MCDLNAIGGCGIVAYEVLRLPQPFIAPISKTVPNTPLAAPRLCSLYATLTWAHDNFTTNIMLLSSIKRKNLRLLANNSKKY